MILFLFKGCKMMKRKPAIHLGEEEIHVLLIEILAFREHIDGIASLLHYTEMQDAERKATPKERIRYITTKGLTKYILGSYIGEDPRSIGFSVNRNGKPSISTRQGTGIVFNLSHSFDCAVVAVSKSVDIGIDIEKIRENIRIDDILPYAFSKKESDVLNGLNPKAKRDLFFTYWSRKEAIIKALGGSVAHHMDKIDAMDRRGGNTWLQVTVEDEPEPWFVWDLPVGSGYKGAICSNRADKSIIMKCINPKELQLDTLFAASGSARN